MPETALNKTRKTIISITLVMPETALNTTSWRVWEVEGDGANGVLEVGGGGSGSDEAPIQKKVCTILANAPMIASKPVRKQIGH